MQTESTFNYDVPLEKFQALPTPRIIAWFHEAQLELEKLRESGNEELKDILVHSMERAQQVYNSR